MRNTTSVADLDKLAYNGKHITSRGLSKILKTPRSTRKAIKPQSIDNTVHVVSDENDENARKWIPLLIPNLRLVFIGFNPGSESWRTGHYYAHFTNLFWKLIYESGIVDRKVTPEDDRKLPDEYGIGFTDLVDRSTAGINELSVKEMKEGAHSLEARLAQFSPCMICIVGKGIWQAIYKAKTGKSLDKTFKWGHQTSARQIGFAIHDVYVVPSTSGLVAGVSRQEKLDLWIKLREYLDKTYPASKSEKNDETKK